MKSNDVFQEYAQLAKQMVSTHAKVSKTLDKALTELDAERTKYKTYNDSNFFAKHQVLITALATPVLVLTTIAIIAWAFVNTGHPIKIDLPGGYKLSSEP